MDLMLVDELVDKRVCYLVEMKAFDWEVKSVPWLVDMKDID